MGHGDEEFLAGRLIAHYRLEELLGEGGMVRLNRATEAQTEFRRILDHRGWDPISQFYPLAYVGLARAAAMAGDSATSRKAYEDFFGLWKDADADLPVLMEARQEYARLK